MANVEFAFTKNFNDKVVCQLNIDAAYFIAPDSLIAKQLIKMAQFTYDITELYTRKFRKDLYEHKNLNTESDFFNPLFEKNMNALNKRLLDIESATKLGEDTTMLSVFSSEVNAELKILADFCYSCKPAKKKRK
jgi:hypothetical protein